jgi:hypothetical protein
LLFKLEGAENVSFGGFTGDEKGRSAILALKSGQDAASTLILRGVNDETKRAYVVWLLREN